MGNEKVISIWTDGSSHNNGEKKGLGGYGSVLIYGELPDTKEELYGHYGDDNKTLEIYGGCENTTNQQQEIKAVTEALKQVTNPSIPIYLFSDSAYVINCMNQKWYAGWITNNWKNSKKEPVKNREYWEELLAVLEDNFFDITWTHVKGHSNIYYNECADVLAGKGTKEMEKKNGFTS